MGPKSMSVVERQNGTVVIRTAITLMPGRDDHLIELVKGAKNLSATIREAMRSGIHVFETADQVEAESVDIDIGFDI